MFQLWLISSGKGLHLTSGVRSAEDYLLLHVESRRKLNPNRAYRWHTGRDKKNHVLTYGCCFWKLAHPTLEPQTPSLPQSHCCGPAPTLSHWIIIWRKRRDARLPSFHLLSQQTCHKHVGTEVKYKVTTLRNILETHICVSALVLSLGCWQEDGELLM